MNSKIPMLVLILLTGTINLSCSTSGDLKPTASLSPIVDTELPILGKVGQEINFTVSHAVYSGCGYYAYQETNKVGTTLTVTFFAQYRTGFCSQDIPILKTNYKFIPNQTGIYTFKFNKGQAGFLVQTILIQ